MRIILIFLSLSFAPGIVIAQTSITGKIFELCNQHANSFAQFIERVEFARNNPDTKAVVRADRNFMLFSDKAAAVGEAVKRGTM